MTHAILMLIKGIPKVPGYSNSSEVGLDSIDLLDPQGFSCETYDMKIPGLKNGAIWADSPLSDGRTLIAGALGNVTETIRLQLTAGTLVQLAAMLSKLLRFKQDCRAFWDSSDQMEPIYLKHQVVGEPGPRYALLYDMDIDTETPAFEDNGSPTRTTTLVIEREYGWRGIAPGDNPKRWTIEQVFTGQAFNQSNASLVSGGDHLHIEEVNNRAEWDLSQTARLSKNFTDIPADKIPGDLPALVHLFLESRVSNIYSRMWLGVTSKPDVLVSGVARKPNYILTIGDASSLGTDCSFAADTGAPIDSDNGGNRRGVCTFGTPSLLARATWAPGSLGTYFDFSTLRGTFAVVLRARLSAGSTSVTLQLTAQNLMGQVDLDPVILTAQGGGGTGNTTAWEEVYLGLLRLPINDQPIEVGDNGLGVSIVTSGVATNLIVAAARTAGAGSLYMCDLLLLPVDEGAFIAETQTVIGQGSGFIYDNTGYYLHGKTGEYVGNNNSIISDVRGSTIMLTPKQQNRLVVFADDTSGTTPTSVITSNVKVYANIVPRWAGLRDE